ncbi:MAG: hypothetical protein LBH95_00180 [Oscillospiraceae bacterium]|jgi:hypothetical protein|nr:hypothetical protein [Oscillospiraceae bacterium]
MDSYNQMGMTPDFADRMERLYPESAAMIAPHARDLVDGLSEDAFAGVNSADIARMADEAARRSGYAANMPAGHNAGTLGDLTRALVVRELIDRHRRGFGGRFPFFYPFFFFPFDGRGFGGRGFDGRGFDGRGFDGFRGPSHRL